jgi:hypothetical protein
VSPVDRLLDPSELASRRNDLTAILTKRMMLRTNRLLTPTWTDVEPVREDMALKLRFRISGERPGALTIHTNLFPYDPQHQTFINIYEREKGGGTDKDGANRKSPRS